MKAANNTPPTTRYLLRSAFTRIFPYILRIGLIQPIRPLSLGFLLLHSAICEGRMKKASIKDAAKANETTTGMMRMNLPITPSKSIKGKNTATVVSIDAKIGGTTSVVPTMAAFALSYPMRI